MSAGLAVIMLSTLAAASAAEFPARPLRLVTAEAGGGVDFAARVIAAELSPRLGQQVIVDNRGGNAAIPAELVAKARPDGHTLLFYSSTIWLLPFIQKGVSWDPVRDFAPVTLAVSSPNILALYPGIPVDTVRDLISYAKSRPGSLNFGTSGTGSSSHLAAELFKAMAGIDIVRVAYKGLGPAMSALISGELQLIFANASAVMPHVKAGRVKGLAVTSGQPSALAPGLPTVSASGLPGYESASINGIFAPAKTPTPIIDRLNREIVAVLSRPDVKERFLAAGVETVGNSPQDFAAKIRKDMAELGKVLRNSAIGQ
jgi:tripartite-type tricarboxylate transporter receptor subunit TctC